MLRLHLSCAQTIGRPALPPYWALGLHEIGEVSKVSDVVNAMKEANLPLDVLSVQPFRKFNYFAAISLP